MSIVKVFNDGNSRIVIDDHCYCVENYQSDRQEWVKSAWIFKEAVDMLKRLPADPNDANLVVWNTDTIWRWILNALSNSDNSEYFVDVADNARAYLGNIEAGTSKNGCDETINILTNKPNVKFLINSVKGEFINISKFVTTNKENVITGAEIARWVSE